MTNKNKTTKTKAKISRVLYRAFAKALATRGTGTFQVAPYTRALTAQEASQLLSEEQRALLRTGEYRLWPKGGGIYHYTANISDSAFIGCTSTVGPFARVGARCVIQDRAVFNGRMVGRTVVSGNAYVSAGCVLENFAHIGDDARLFAGARVGGRVYVGYKMEVSENVRLGGEFRLVGNFRLTDADFSIGDNLIIDKAQQITAVNTVFRLQTR